MAGTKLDSDRIIETVQVLARRMRERFPNAGLNDVCNSLLAIARQARQRAIEIGRPMIWVRVLSGTIIVLILALFGLAVSVIKPSELTAQSGEFVQVLDAAFNALVLIGATVLFLVTLETRIKRAGRCRRSTSCGPSPKSSICTSSPRIRNGRSGRGETPSPLAKRTMTQFELIRYLDYCSEMLALAGKIAALYVEDFPDSASGRRGQRPGRPDVGPGPQDLAEDHDPAQCNRP